MKFKDFQAPVLFSNTFKALNLEKKIIQVLSRMCGNPVTNLTLQALNVISSHPKWGSRSAPKFNRSLQFSQKWSWGCEVTNKVHSETKSRCVRWSLIHRIVHLLPIANFVLYKWHYYYYNISSSSSISVAIPNICSQKHNQQKYRDQQQASSDHIHHPLSTTWIRLSNQMTTTTIIQWNAYLPTWHWHWYNVTIYLQLENESESSADTGNFVAS